MTSLVSSVCSFPSEAGFQSFLCRVKHAALSLLLLVLPLAAASAQTWNGGTGNWSNANNWTPAVVPNDPLAVVYIDNANPVNSVVTYDLVNGYVGQLTLDAGDSLNVTSGNTLVGRDTNIFGTMSNAGVYQGHLDNLGVVNNNGGTFYAQLGGFTNLGVVNNNIGAIWADPLDNSGTINNNGLLYTDLGSNIPLGWSNSGTINNSGVIYRQAGWLDFNNTGVINNYGVLQDDSLLNNSGTVYNRGTFIGYAVNSGTFINYATGNLDVQYSFTNTGIFANFGTLANEGTFSSLTPFSNTGIINNTGDFQINDTLNNSGTINNISTGLFESDGGIIVNSGTINNNSAYYSGFSGLNIDNAGTVNNISGIMNVLLLKNFGTINNSGGLYADAVNNSGIINNGNSGDFAIFTGTVYNSTNGTINNYAGSLLENYGTIINRGMIAIANGATLINYSGSTYSQLVGRTVVDGLLISPTPIYITGGTLSGSGIIQSDVVMGGTLSPGDSPGVLTVQGNYTQLAGGTFFAELAGLTPGTQYDQLLVSGAAALDGTLDVTLLNGFLVSLGDSFVLMTFGSETGQFSISTCPVVCWRDVADFVQIWRCHAIGSANAGTWEPPPLRQWHCRVDWVPAPQVMKT